MATVGEDKWFGGRFASLILKDLGYPIIETRNAQTERRPVTISTSRLPLLEKINKIMDGVCRPSRKLYKPTEPTHGFWGVPPHDMTLLELFPDSTHVYGSSRCAEAGVPTDLDLEMVVDPGIPTIFYAQTFCQKTMLARYLADKHGGLYIDCDGQMTNSLIAKVTAFIRLG